MKQVSPRIDSLVNYLTLGIICTITIIILLIILQVIIGLLTAISMGA